jgi:hypothetical protein
MAFLTRNQIMQKVLNELSLVSGTSVQIYTEPVINDYIQRAFDHLFTKYFWEHLTVTTMHTLDGTAGVVTDSLIGIDSLIDIKWIREEPFRECNEINYFNDGIFDIGRTGYMAFPYTHPQYEDKKLQFFPKNVVKNILIRARRKPPLFENNHIVPFDSLALIHLVSANALTVDGMNPAAQARQDGLFEDRYQTLISQESNNKIVSQNSFYTNSFTVANT